MTAKEKGTGMNTDEGLLAKALRTLEQVKEHLEAVPVAKGGTYDAVVRQIEEIKTPACVAVSDSDRVLAYAVFKCVPANAAAGASHSRWATLQAQV